MWKADAFHFADLNIEERYKNIHVISMENRN